LICFTRTSAAWTRLRAGLKIAAAIRKDGRLAEFVKERYSSWDSGIGKEIESGKSNFAALEKYMLKKGEPAANTSGRQEFLENLINEFISRRQ
jgi:xylose isomerase